MKINKILEETLKTLKTNHEADLVAAEEKAKNGTLLTINVIQDEDPVNPREWRIGKMICEHKKYSVGDAHKFNFENCSNWNEFRETIIEIESKNIIILPVFMYDHSGGVRLSTESFICRFDSGQIGFIYAKKGVEDCSDEELIEHLKAEVEIYSKYLNGESYTYTIKNSVTSEVLESCAGYYSEKDALDAAETALAELISE